MASCPNSLVPYFQPPFLWVPVLVESVDCCARRRQGYHSHLAPTWHSVATKCGHWEWWPSCHGVNSEWSSCLCLKRRRGHKRDGNLYIWTTCKAICLAHFSMVRTGFESLSQNTNGKGKASCWNGKGKASYSSWYSEPSCLSMSGKVKKLATHG